MTPGHFPEIYNFCYLYSPRWLYNLVMGTTDTTTSTANTTTSSTHVSSNAVYESVTTTVMIDPVIDTSRLQIPTFEVETIPASVSRTNLVALSTTKIEDIPIALDTTTPNNIASDALTTSSFRGHARVFSDELVNGIVCTACFSDTPVLGSNNKQSHNHGQGQTHEQKYNRDINSDDIATLQDIAANPDDILFTSYPSIMILDDDSAPLPVEDVNKSSPFLSLPIPQLSSEVMSGSTSLNLFSDSKASLSNFSVFRTTNTQASPIPELSCTVLQEPSVKTRDNQQSDILHVNRFETSDTMVSLDRGESRDHTIAFDRVEPRDPYVSLDLVEPQDPTLTLNRIDTRVSSVSMNLNETRNSTVSTNRSETRDSTVSMNHSETRNSTVSMNHSETRDSTVPMSERGTTSTYQPTNQRSFFCLRPGVVCCFDVIQQECIKFD